jgi:hypothetical protein
MYFKTPDERSSIETLALAAHLSRHPHDAAHGPDGHSAAQPPGSFDRTTTSSGSTSSSSTKSAAAGGMEQGSAPHSALGGGHHGPLQSQWARVYGHEHGELILQVLAAWMDEETSAKFLQYHKVRIVHKMFEGESVVCSMLC